MHKLTGKLKSIAKRLPLVEALAAELRFRRQLAEHRRLIQPYLSDSGAKTLGLVAEGPLLIGYFETGFGLGEYARGLATALEAVGAPFGVYPYNSYTGRAREETSWTRKYDVDRAYPINVFCMAADQTPNARRIIGGAHTRGRYNILSTFWELSRAPESWRADLEFFDELWVPTGFVAESFRPIFSKPVIIIPPCVTVNEATADRRRFALDPAKFYFMFSFDLNSYPERKNPAALLEAFGRAFDRRDDVGLILKISGEINRFAQPVAELTATAKRDRRITVLQGEWKRDALLTLMASVDCYASLHRAEGFGFGMAESMLLGKPVIATAYSSNTEFLTAETGYPVPYQLRPIGAGEYPDAGGNLWAEPDIDCAARAMQTLASKAAEVPAKALAGQAFIRRHHSPQAVGRKLAERLQQLRAKQ